MVRENTMEIRKATGDEMLALWEYPDPENASPTAKFFYRSISSGNAVFWTIERHGELIGELYVFKNIEADPDFADGITTAYLCAFRVREDCRGQGLGTRLIETVLTDLKAGGFRRATIGVGPDEERNVKLYRRLGFTTKVKDCRTDPCAMNEHMQPVQEEDTWWLLSKELT